MAEPTEKTRGEIACDAFAAHLIANPMGGVIDGGGLSTSWSQYSELGKAAWEAAADVIRRDAIEECIRKASQELTFAGPADALSAVEDYRELLLDDLQALKSPEKSA